MIGTYHISQATTNIRTLIHGKFSNAKILDLPILSGKYKNWYAFIEPFEGICTSEDIYYSFSIEQDGIKY